MRKRIPYRFPTSLLRLTLLFAAAASSGTAFGQLSVLASSSPKPAEQGVTIGPEGPVVPPPRPGQPAPTRGPQQIKLTITPAAEPVPALKYRFDVPPMERRPGNSVPYYYRAVLMISQGDHAEVVHRAFSDMELPLKDADKVRVRELVASSADILAELDRAVVREDTDWDWRLQELDGLESIAFRLEEAQQARALGMLLQLKARLAIAEGRYDDAVKTLRAGYTLARDVAEPPTLINDLVGVAIASILNVAVREWIAQPGSPNLYWAIASQPDPLIDFRPALEYEMDGAYRFAPWLKDAETDAAPPAVWRERFSALLQVLLLLDSNIFRGSGSYEDDPDLRTRMFMAGFALRSYPVAKQALLERDLDTDQVEAMPVGKVLAIQQKYVDDVISQELLKAALVPTPMRANVADRAESSLKSRGFYEQRHFAPTREPLPMMSLLMPAVRQASHAGVRLATYQAALKTIEAIRMHAAATGALPKSLDEIDAVPVPKSPFTGEPFPYRVEAGTAILEVVVETRYDVANWHVELTLKK